MHRPPPGYVPLRIFLDTNALQAILDYGGSVFEGEPFVKTGRSGASADDVEALRCIMLFAQRDAFDFALSQNSLREAAAATDGQYLRWAYDVLDHWEARWEADHAVRDDLDTALVALDRACGYLSAADGALIRDALQFGCDTFLTIERRLARNAAHLSRALGIEVIRPPELWDVLKPHVKGL